LIHFRMKFNVTTETIAAFSKNFIKEKSMNFCWAKFSISCAKTIIRFYTADL
jgi:hypothetical protein